MESLLNKQEYQWKNFSSDEVEEIEGYQYNSDTLIDEAIERVKKYDSEIERLQNIYKERVEKLKAELDYKVEKLEKKKNWDLFNLKNIVMQSSNKRETKTMYILDSLSGNVQIKKPQQKLVKPKLKEEVIKEKFADYKKTKTEIDLNWAELKKNLVIHDNKVINKATGEDLSEFIPVEEVPEEVVVK